MTDDLVKRLREEWMGMQPPSMCLEAADRIEQLEARVLLLEGWLTGSLNIIEAFVAADTTKARAALAGEKKDEDA